MLYLGIGLLLFIFSMLGVGIKKKDKELIVGAIVLLIYGAAPITCCFMFWWEFR